MLYLDWVNLLVFLVFYHWFGCGEGGGIINFIQKVESILFRQTLKKEYEILRIPLVEKY